MAQTKGASNIRYASKEGLKSVVSLEVQTTLSHREKEVQVGIGMRFAGGLGIVVGINLFGVLLRSEPPGKPRLKFSLDEASKFGIGSLIHDPSAGGENEFAMHIRANLFGCFGLRYHLVCR